MARSSCLCVAQRSAGPVTWSCFWQRARRSFAIFARSRPKSESPMGNDPRREINSVRMWYDQVAETFSTRYTGIGGEFWRSFEDELALDLLGFPNRVLDLGCGTGRLSAALAGRGASVLGIDFSMSMIAVARSAAHHEG